MVRPPEDDLGKTRGTTRTPKKAAASKAPQSSRPTSAADAQTPETVIANMDPHLAAITGSIPFITWIAAPDGAFEYFNDALVRFTGCSPESLLGDRWLSTIHPDDRPAVVADWEASIATGDPYEVECRILGTDGEYRWHLVRAEKVLGDDGRVLRWWGTAVDIHERCLREAHMRQLASDREAVLGKMAEGVYTLDREFRFTYVNSRAEALLGHTAKALIGNVLWDVLTEMRDSALGLMLIRVLETGQCERLLDYPGADDTSFDIWASALPDGLVVHLHDITEVKALSGQLVASQRLEALGQLAGGIAHDFNNLLTVVMGAAQSLEEEAHLSSTSREIIDLVNQAAVSGSELTHRLLAFARRQPLVPQPIDVSRHVGNLIPLLKRTLAEGIELSSNLARNPPLALADPGQFESALLNLTINARDAMPDGGMLEFETSTIEIDEESPVGYGDTPPGTYVVVSVSDTGVGVPPENMSRLFDPFFTTKSLDKGSGLGLPMVLGFARQSGGNVTVHSKLGRGTTVRLYLPVVATEIPQDAESWLEPEPLVRGTGHVLLAEGSELLRRFTTDCLIARGYHVTSVGSGPEAMRALDTIDRIDLLFTDVIMVGGMTGRQLAAEVLARRPGTPVLYTSGYTEEVLMHEGQLDPDMVLLAKPYSMRRLLEAIQRHLPPPQKPPKRPGTNGPKIESQ